MNEPTADQDLRSRRAASFGASAGDYAEHRPDYPDRALRWGISGSSSEPRHVLDLAAGTGKVTEGLLALGLEVTAVEPDAAMLAELGRRFPQVKTLAGQAEQIPLPDASVDTVFVGQAFHWFDVDPALTEIARVLRPGGVLVPLWNHDDMSVPWVAEFDARHWTGVSRSWAAGTDELPTHPAFEPFERETFHYAQRRTADSLVATLATHSHMLVAPLEERKKTLQAARDFLAATPETASGEFDRPIVTTVFRGRRVAG